MKNVIVTGANGFIGSTFIVKLVELGIRVVAIDVSFASSRIPEDNLVVKIESDLNDIEKITSLLPDWKYDAFYHFAWHGVNGADKANPTVQLNNIQLAINCADIVKNIGCDKYLCAGTIAEQSVNSLPGLANINGGMMYGVAKHCTHLMLEAYCKSIDVSFVWMQFSNIYGVGNRTGNLVSYTLGELLGGKEATFGPAAQPYDFIYVDDLLEAVYRLGKESTRQSAYYIGSGSPRILKEYILQIGELCGMKDKIAIGVRPDDGIIYDFSMFNTADLVHDVGKYVTTSFENGILKTIDWLKSE